MNFLQKQNLNRPRILFGAKPNTSSTSSSKPSAPTGLATQQTTSSSIDLVWNAGARAASYNVYQATTLGGTYTIVANVTTLSHTAIGLAAATPYYFYVKSVGFNGHESAASNTVTESTDS